MPRARLPAALRPNRDIRAYASLNPGAQDTLLDRFLRRPFTPPDNPRGRQLQAGQWLPMQPDYMQGEQPLGEGGVGIVHLWCCVDHRGRILDRVVVKQVHPGVYTWERKETWRDGRIGGEPRDCMLGNQVHDNLETMAPGHGKFVTQCLGYGGIQDPLGPNPQADEDAHLYFQWTGRYPFKDIAGYRLYFEYCPFGDLGDAIQRQKLAREPFHEGFIWMTFEALAEATVAMDQSKIVHADIQTGNILLSNSDPQRFKIWPTPKLADFGASHIIDKATRRRFMGSSEAMHPYFTPPELTRDSNNSDWAVPGLHVTNKTNVWSIGLIICCMMRLEPTLPETARVDPPTAQQLRFDIPTQREIRRFQHSSANYSQDLRKLARACLKYQQADRPTPKQLLRKVRRLMAGHLGGFDTYGVNTRIPWNKKERLQGRLKDEWAPGTGTEIRLRV